MSFITLATEAQKELDAEKAKLRDLEVSLNTRASAVAAQLALAESRTGELNAKAKELQAREEDVSRREITVRRDTDVEADRIAAAGDRVEADKSLKKAQELRDESLRELEKIKNRELALSEREKTYKQDIELQVMRNFTFGRK